MPYSGGPNPPLPIGYEVEAWKQYWADEQASQGLGEEIMFDHNAFVASQGPNLDPPDVEDHDCEQDRCPHCGRCHVVLNPCFTEACAAYVTTCVRCLKVIEAGAPKEVLTYPNPGWHHQACYDAACREMEDETRREREAEIRNEEALYGYELPRY